MVTKSNGTLQMGVNTYSVKLRDEYEPLVDVSTIRFRRGVLLFPSSSLFCYTFEWVVRI